MTRAHMIVKGMVLLWLATWAGAAVSHEMSMAELDMRETAKGQFIWSWGQSGTNLPIAADLTPVWPEGCVASAEELSLRCPSAGMVGTLAVDGVGKRYSAAMVRVVWLDGQSRVYTITTAQPSVYLYGAHTSFALFAMLAMGYGCALQRYSAGRVRLFAALLVVLAGYNNGGVYFEMIHFLRQQALSP